MPKKAQEAHQAIPRVTGLFQLPGGNLVIDATRAAISAETITGGVPDASDPLPEGTIIVKS